MRLWSASMDGVWDQVKACVKEGGVDVNARCDEEYVEILEVEWEGLNRTALHFACLADEESIGNLAVVEGLIRIGADVNARDDLGDTPLHYAAMGGNADVCALLAVHGADPTVRNKERPVGGGGDAGEALREWEDDSWMFGVQGRGVPFAEREGAGASPGVTPGEMSFLAGDYSTPRARMVMSCVDELYGREGRCEASVLEGMVAAGDLELERQREEYDEAHGATEAAMTLDERPDREIQGFGEEKWEKIKRMHHYNITESLKEAREVQEKFERIERANDTWVDGTEIADDVHPSYKPYPDTVPMRARSWATFESGLWTHPEFEGRIMEDHCDAEDWPMKHHWEKTPDYPEGLWQCYDPDLTKNLTAEERARAEEGNRKRLEQEAKLADHPDTIQGDRIWRAMRAGKYPPPKVDRDKGMVYARFDDPLDEKAAELEGEQGSERPWTLMDKLEQAKECERLQNIQWEIDREANRTQHGAWWENITVADADRVQLRPMQIDVGGGVREATLDHSLEPLDEHDPECDGEGCYNSETTDSLEEATFV